MSKTWDSSDLIPGDRVKHPSGTLIQIEQFEIIHRRTQKSMKRWTFREVLNDGKFGPVITDSEWVEL